MSTWTFADGSAIASGGTVAAAGAAAQECVHLIEHKVPINVSAIPSKKVPVAASSDYMLDLLARHVAAGTVVSTDYVPRVRDAPAEVRRIRRAVARSMRRSPPGTVY